MFCSLLTFLIKGTLNLPPLGITVVLGKRLLGAVAVFPQLAPAAAIFARVAEGGLDVFNAGRPVLPVAVVAAAQKAAQVSPDGHGGAGGGRGRLFAQLSGVDKWLF